MSNNVLLRVLYDVEWLKEKSLSMINYFLTKRIEQNYQVGMAYIANLQLLTNVLV